MTLWITHNICDSLHQVSSYANASNVDTIPCSNIDLNKNVIFINKPHQPGLKYHKYKIITQWHEYLTHNICDCIKFLAVQ